MSYSWIAHINVKFDDFAAPVVMPVRVRGATERDAYEAALAHYGNTKGTILGGAVYPDPKAPHTGRNSWTILDDEDPDYIFHGAGGDPTPVTYPTREAALAAARARSRRGKASVSRELYRTVVVG